ncbi:glycosyltransferase family 39 protein [Halosquirtibacter xylanolyticus]|uniref:ArnT family glycosyltransferase n=1 Tax=Halosquirtibacter xylanolyticus TaxID=3374599 RepID=UPI003748FA77|nr:glycosyltransferase family 39 protein [Prolixibacteraceae bacterium]
MKKATILWWTMSLVTFVILITFPLELHFDEAQYWSWSNKLQWSYYSKPPLIAFLNYLSNAILGQSEISIRMWSWIFGNLTALVFYSWVKYITKDSEQAFRALGIYYLFPHYWYTVLFFTTDVILLFFYMLFILVLTKIYFKDRLRDWFLLGVIFSLGLLSKYAMIIALLPTIYVVFRKKLSWLHFFIFLGITLIGSFPIVGWAATHDYVSFKHLFHLSVSVHNDFSLVHSFRNMFEFLGGQFLLLGGFVFVFVFSGIKRQFESKSITSQLVLIPYLMTILVFVVMSFTRKNASHINWTLFVVCPMPYILFLGVEKLKNKGGFYMLSILSILLYFFIFDGIYQGRQAIIARVVPIEDVTKRLVGWEALSNTLESEVDKKNKTVIICEHYGIASELMFYSGDRFELIYFNRYNRMNQYDLWFSSVYEKYKDWDAIIVSRHPDIESYRGCFKVQDTTKTFVWSNENYSGEMFYLHRVKGIKNLSNENVGF